MNQTVAIDAEDKYRLRNIGSSHASRMAAPGKFKAVVGYDSDDYQVGQDWPTREEAFTAIIAGAGLHCTLQIYDDAGKPLLTSRDGRVQFIDNIEGDD